MEVYIYLSTRTQGHSSNEVESGPRVECFGVKMSCKSDKRPIFLRIQGTGSLTLNKVKAQQNAYKVSRKKTKR